MAISRISSQDKSGNTLAGTTTITYPVATTTGNLLIVAYVSSIAQGSAGISSSGWTLLKEPWRTSFTLLVGWKISTGDTSVVILTDSGAGRYVAYEYTGNSATQPDGNASIPSGNTNGTSSVTNWTTPSISTNSANDLILHAVAGDGTLSAFSWTNATNLSGGSNTYQLNIGEYIVSATQSAFTDKLSWTGNSAGASAISFAFQGAGVTPTIIPSSTLLMMGV